MSIDRARFGAKVGTRRSCESARTRSAHGVRSRRCAWGAALCVAFAALSSCTSTPDDSGGGADASEGDAARGSDGRGGDDGSADRSASDGDAADDGSGATLDASSDGAAPSDANGDGGLTTTDGDADAGPPADARAGDDSSIDAGDDAAPDAGASDGDAPMCAPVTDVPGPSCAIYPYGNGPSAVYQAYVPSATTSVTVEYVAPSPGGNNAYAVRFPCVDSPDIACISTTNTVTFVPGAAGWVYVVGYGAAAPTLIVGAGAPPNTTCDTAMPIALDQPQSDPRDYGDSLPRFFSFTLPATTSLTVQGTIFRGTIYLHLYAACGGPSLADAGAASSLYSNAVAQSAPVTLPAGTYILEADASSPDDLSVLVDTQ